MCGQSVIESKSKHSQIEEIQWECIDYTCYNTIRSADGARDRTSTVVIQEVM